MNSSYKLQRNVYSSLTSKLFSGALGSIAMPISQKLCLVIPFEETLLTVSGNRWVNETDYSREKQELKGKILFLSHSKYKQVAIRKQKNFIWDFLVPQGSWIRVWNLSRKCRISSWPWTASYIDINKRRNPHKRLKVWGLEGISASKTSLSAIFPHYRRIISRFHFRFIAFINRTPLEQSR